VIGLTIFGNFSKYACMYMFPTTVFQSDFNRDGDYVIRRGCVATLYDMAIT